MKFISMALLLICTMSGCTPSVPPPSEVKPRVVSTIAMIDDLVAEVAGGVVQRDLLITGELDPHSYELVKGDDEKLDSAALIIANGLGLEHGASLQSRLEPSPTVCLIGSYVESHFPDRLIWKQGSIDPHIWMDVSLWAEAVDPIVEALARLLPHEAEGFAVRGERLKERLLALHQKIYATLHTVPSPRRYLVTSHDAFAYFTRAYLSDIEELWSDRCIAPDGIAPEGQMSLLDIRRVADHMRAFGITTVFPESNVSRDPLAKVISVCNQLGHPAELADIPLYGDSFGESRSYAEMMWHNCTALERYMKESSCDLH
jgi:manganese/zinc/iron transport system substrate-binding protein